jgi:hypothetical protein
MVAVGVDLRMVKKTEAAEKLGLAIHQQYGRSRGANSVYFAAIGVAVGTRGAVVVWARILA